MNTRAEPSICLGPTGNIQGTYFFLHLRTGRRVKRRAFTPLPMLPHIIERVHQLADADKQNPALDFLDRNGNDFQDPAEDGEIPGVDLDVAPHNIAGEIAGVNKAAGEIPGVNPEADGEIPGVNHGDAVKFHDNANVEDDDNVVDNEAVAEEWELDANPDAAMPPLPPPPPPAEPDPILPKVEPEEILVETVTDKRDEGKDHDEGHKTAAAATEEEDDDDDDNDNSESDVENNGSDDDSDSTPDDGAIETEEGNLYHPSAPSPSKQRTWSFSHAAAKEAEAQLQIHVQRRTREYYTYRDEALLNEGGNKAIQGDRHRRSQVRMPTAA